MKELATKANSAESCGTNGTKKITTYTAKPFLPALNGLNLLLHHLRPPSQHHSIPTPVCAGPTVVDLTYQQLNTVPTQQIHVHVDDM